MSDPVLNLLQDKKLQYTVSGRDYLIKCLNPKHEDTNPSLRVDKVTGISHCFACGFKRNLFRHFGIFTDTSSIRVAQLKEKLKELSFSNVDLALPKGAIPYNTSIRGISTQTLRKFGAFFTHEEAALEDRICFPVKDILDRTVVFIGRHMSDSIKPKYKFYPGHVQVPAYPLKFDTPSKHAVLVEGIFDLLNLVDKGMSNVVCTFGTQTLKNDAEKKLLPLKVQGIVKLFILYDGDEAGISAAKEIKPLLESAGFIVEILELPEGMDPGDLNKEYVDSIKVYTNDGRNETNGD